MRRRRLHPEGRLRTRPPRGRLGRVRPRRLNGPDPHARHAAPSTGTEPVTVVPAPGALRIETSPPIACSRSVMPWRPVPNELAFGSKPCPSSVTVKVSAPSRSASATVVDDALAYFATLFRASRHEK